MSNIYNSKFVSAVRSILAIACADGSRITREELSERLEHEGYEVSSAALKVSVEEGAFNAPKQAYALFAGRFGGIRELDLEETAKVEMERAERQAKVTARINKRLATIAARKVASVSTAEVQATV